MTPAEKAIRAYLFQDVDFVDESVAEWAPNLAAKVEAAVRAQVSDEILAERANLPAKTVDERIFQTGMVLAARIATVGPTRAPQGAGGAHAPERGHGEGSGGCEASRGRSEAQQGEG